ncbi:hypothetical protein [Ralstonia holmesii]|uniref:hypothetical protein n=1 Tax=Ralstonia holmesii TaxID=3058602 RepID=UPI0028F65B2C|nr:hypothetical protein [Ralstonia sp. LMG 32967]CAJ0685880.1 hypothetical protein R11007_00598 [Ralstonia sp. LMG 32967]
MRQLGVAFTESALAPVHHCHVPERLPLPRCGGDLKHSIVVAGVEQVIHAVQSVMHLLRDDLLNAKVVAMKARHICEVLRAPGDGIASWPEKNYAFSQ